MKKSAIAVVVILICFIFLTLLNNVVTWWDTRSAKQSEARLSEIRAQAKVKRAQEFPSIKSRLLSEAIEQAKTNPVAAQSKLAPYSDIADQDLQSTLKQVTAMADKVRAAQAQTAAQEAKLKAERELYELHSKRCDDQYTADAVGQYIVKSLLKAPSTAKFPGKPDLREPDLPSRKRYIAKHKLPTDACVRVAMITVDAQNSFGAMLRQQYGVILYLPLKADAVWVPLEVVNRN